MKTFDIDLTVDEKAKLAFEIMEVCKQYGLATGTVKKIGWLVEHRLPIYRQVAVIHYIRDQRRSA